MGHLDLTYAALGFDATPDWDAAERVIEEPGAALEASGLFEAEEISSGEAQAMLRKDLASFGDSVEIILGHGEAAKLTTLSFARHLLFITGDEGDAHTELYFAMKRLRDTGVLTAAGFRFNQPLP